MKSFEGRIGAKKEADLALSPANPHIQPTEVSTMTVIEIPNVTGRHGALEGDTALGGIDEAIGKVAEILGGLIKVRHMEATDILALRCEISPAEANEFVWLYSENARPDLWCPDSAFHQVVDIVIDSETYHFALDDGTTVRDVRPHDTVWVRAGF